MLASLHTLGSGQRPIEIYAFDQNVSKVYAGSVASFATSGATQAILQRGAMGASDLKSALVAAGARNRHLVLFSDLSATAGQQDVKKLVSHIKRRNISRLDIVAPSHYHHELANALVGAGSHLGTIMAARSSGKVLATRLVRPVHSQKRSR